MISELTLSKVQFHSTPERARKDWLAELYLRVNIDREVCAVYIFIMIYFAFLLHRFLLIVLLLIRVSCHVNFRSVANKPLSPKANNEKRKQQQQQKGPDFVITGIGLLEVKNNAYSEQRLNGEKKSRNI